MATPTKHRETTIRLVVPNLRHRWPDALKPYSDNAVAALYEDFSMSDDFGNNDEYFPDWFEMLPDYEKKGE